jgi:hypothetical protein
LCVRDEERSSPTRNPVAFHVRDKDFACEFLSLHKNSINTRRGTAPKFNLTQEQGSRPTSTYQPGGLLFPCAIVVQPIALFRGLARAFVAPNKAQQKHNPHLAQSSIDKSEADDMAGFHEMGQTKTD